MRKFVLIIFFITFLTPAWASGFLKKQTREQKVDVYLEEFCSPALKEATPNIYKAIRTVLILLPDYAFRKATDRSYPAFFLEVPHYGNSPWADSIAITQDPRDPVAFNKGVWIVQLNIALDKAKDVEAIEGIVFHELAHKVLGHHGGVFNIEIEKQANRQVKKWGFGAQYLKAKEEFGTHKALP